MTARTSETPIDPSLLGTVERPTGDHLKPTITGQCHK